jgi:hypothetical protein
MGKWMYRAIFFLTSALAGGEWSASHPGNFTPRERALGSHCIEGWVDPRAGLGHTKKGKFLILPGLELRPLGRPGRSYFFIWILGGWVHTGSTRHWDHSWPIVPAPVDCEVGEVGGMNGFDRGNRSTRIKPAPTPLCPPKIPLARPGREPGSPR